MLMILVRHAMPAFCESVPPELWPLSEEGVAAARALSLPPDAYLVSSLELKAFQTLEPFGEVVRDGRFNEVRRTDEPWEGDYRELRRTYVDGADHAGWEPREEVVARFTAAVSEHTAQASGRPLVVGTHGMAMTVWITATTALPSPSTYWASLTLPDARPFPATQ